MHSKSAEIQSLPEKKGIKGNLMKEKNLRRIKRIVIAIFVALVLYTLAGFVIVPMVLKSVLPEKLSDLLHRPVSVSAIHLNPYTLTVSIDNFEIRKKSAPSAFVSFGRLFVDVQWRSLFDRGLVIREIRLEKPFVGIDRISGTKFNFSDLLAGEKSVEKPAGEKKPSKPFRFSIANIHITDGKVVFFDAPLQKKHVFAHLDFSLPFVSDFQQYVNTFNKPQIEGRFNNTRVSLKMETKPFSTSKDTVVDLSLTGIHIPYYIAYLPSDLGFEINKGDVNIRSRIAFEKKVKGIRLRVSGNVALSNLSVVDRSDQPILSLPELKLVLAPSLPLEGRVEVASIQLDRPALSIVRKADGKINLLELGPKSGETEKPAAAAPQNPRKADKHPFRIDVDQLQLNDGKIGYTDLAAGQGTPAQADRQPVRFELGDLQLAVNGFSNQPEKRTRFDVSGQINQKGQISADGELVLSPLSVQGHFGVKDIRLAWAQPYLPKNVRLVVKNGGLFASGDAGMKKDADGSIAATLKGKAAIRDFAVSGSAGGNDVVSWKDFSVDGIDVTTHPVNVAMGKISALDFTGRITREADGALNLQKMFAPAEPPAQEKAKAEKTKAPAPAEKSSAVPISIGEVSLKNFGVRFTDKKISPNFSTRLDLSSLKVTGLSSKSFKAADITAKGQINGHAPLAISGKINPLKKDLFLNMKFDLSDMDLSPFSPYSGKYIGRDIEKGKLNLNLAYRIDKKQLDSQNKVLLDQFTLGRSVDSPDAIGLPVGTAVALLKDRQGQINLDLPVSGRLDDPEFSVWGVILQSLKNILVKAATSPFDLVASIVGGGPDIQFIEFSSGSAIITAESEKKITAVDKLLYERPGLTLGLTGYVDPKTDRAALAREMLEKKIEAFKLAEIVKKGSPVPEKVTLTPEERLQYLKQLYKSEILAHPEKGQKVKPLTDKTLTEAEMEKLLEAQITVTDNDLRRLADQRAQKVQDALLADARIKPKRLFLVAAQTLSPQPKKNITASRVDLSIR